MVTRRYDLGERPAGCACARHVVDMVTETIEGDTSLCPYHDAVAIQRDEAEAEVDRLRDAYEPLRREIYGEPDPLAGDPLAQDLRTVLSESHPLAEALTTTSREHLPLNASADEWASAMGISDHERINPGEHL